ncbi:MAG: hypothetical protein R3C53_04970 [Pirellulaceae bacterium]
MTTSAEVDELNLTVRKLLEGKRREKFPWTVQQLALEFPDDPELQEALQLAKAEAAGITEESRSSGPAPKAEERRREVPRPLTSRVCRTPLRRIPSDTGEHGERKIIRYDEVETLVLKRPELFVRVTRYPIFVAPVSRNAD